MKKGRRAMSLLAALSILFMAACGAEQTESDPAPMGTKPADAIEHDASHESSEADQAGGDMTASEVPEVRGFRLWADTVQASAGEDDVTLRVFVNENPGILGMRFSVIYDEAVMTLEGAESGEAVSDALTMTPPGVFCSGCCFVWDGVELDKSDVGDGTVLLLHFRISEDAQSGSYPISLCYGDSDIVDNDLQILSPDTRSGCILIDR